MIQIKTEYDDSLVINNEIVPIKGKDIKNAKLEREYDNHLVINNVVSPIVVNDETFNALVKWSKE